MRDNDGDIRFSLRESANIEAMSMKYYAAHKVKSAAHISEDMLTAANEIVQKMTDYMLPFLDIKDNNGYRYLPEEILGKTTHLQMGHIARPLRTLLSATERLHTSISPMKSRSS